MYLFERMLGTATFFLVLIVACNSLYVANGKQIKQRLLLYITALAFLAFIFIPNQGADLSRLYYALHLYGTMDIYDIARACSHSSTPAMVIYFWAIGMLRVDALLPMISCALFYSLVFSCYWDFAERLKIDVKIVALAIILCMSSGIYFQVISNIRSYLATALVFRAFYTEQFTGRSPFKNILYYLVAALFHSFGLALVILRVVHICFTNSKNMLQKLLSTAFVLLIVFLMMRYGGSYLNALSDKATDYIAGESYFYIWEVIIHSLQIAITVFLLIKLFRIDCTVDQIVRNNLALFIVLITMVAVMSLPFDYSIFLRTSVLLSLVSPLVLMLLSSAWSKKEHDCICAVVFTWSTVSLCLACARGDLSSYKFLLL